MLSVRNIGKSFQTRLETVEALKGVSFEVGQGEVFTLLGPSGCGKTTMLRSIAGLEVPDYGEILLADKPVFRGGKPRIAVPPHQRDIAMVFQSYAIWPHMTVGQNVGFPLDVSSGAIDDRTGQVADSLRKVGLGGYENRPATDLSGGQQQRVALARAIIKDAAVCLFDEPLSNLDAKLRVEMRDEIRNLQQNMGLTAVYVTHDQDEAIHLSDRIAVMSLGQVVELDSPENLYLRPRDRFTAQFIGEAHLLPVTSASRDGDHMVAETTLGRIVAAAFPNSDYEISDLMVRPEHITLYDPASPPSDSTNVFRGRVTARGFNGKLVNYKCVVNDVELDVHTTSTVIYDLEGEVLVQLPPSRCVLVGSRIGSDDAADREVAAAQTA